MVRFLKLRLRFGFGKNWNSSLKLKNWGSHLEEGILLKPLKKKKRDLYQSEHPKIQYEKKLWRLNLPKSDPALLPRTATAIGGERRCLLSLGQIKKACAPEKERKLHKSEHFVSSSGTQKCLWSVVMNHDGLEHTKQYYRSCLLLTL
ncbi:uncharacterized protein LOC121053081 [Rosa chinensis]|uniref:uncharacterized protein LOC121053081 n=1 Tax=Rosa chinensis TaxID=74649 RepID=UPI001AD8DC8B|nr:uncharacterized protein LOC121053081 [Rosa chinensis]